MSPSRSFLPIVRTVFDSVLIPHGFALEHEVSQDDRGSGGDVVWYRAGTRTVSVAYAPARERWCEVSLQGYGEPESVTDLATFVHGLAVGRPAHYATTDPVAFEREARTCAEQLVAACGEFLRGDLAAFRERYAELLRVQDIRNQAYTRWAARDIEGVERWYSLIERYLRQDERARLAAARSELSRARLRRPR